jgi:hypothetical protein
MKSVNVIKTQYSETNVMRFLLRIKGLYMFRALLAHPQEALHKRHLVLRAYNVSWLCHDCTQYTNCRFCSAS